MRTFTICPPLGNPTTVSAPWHVTIHDIAKDYPTANIYWLGAPLSALPSEYCIIRYTPTCTTMPKYQVIVSNIGNVYDGSDFKVATDTYREYLAQSKDGYGRASGESVVLLEDGFQYFPAVLWRKCEFKKGNQYTIKPVAIEA
jgi:hypothetical protein